jgi:predicted nucleic acid-binding protein
VLIVADTSPINYLILIQQISVLPKLYTRVLIPPAVFYELTSPAAPSVVRQWTATSPAWIEILSPKKFGALAALDLGESQAISLASEVGASVLLMDEQAGRR